MNTCQIGEGGSSLFLFFFLFTLDYLSEHSHSHTGLILLIAQNLPHYLHFIFCLFVWLIKNSDGSLIHLTSRSFRGSYVTLRGKKGELGALRYGGMI